MRYSGTRVSGGLALRPHFASRSWNALRTAPSWSIELSKLVESIVVGLDGGVRRLEIERHTHNWGRHSLQRKLPWRRSGLFSVQTGAGRRCAHRLSFRIAFRREESAFRLQQQIPRA